MVFDEVKENLEFLHY